MRNEGVTSIFLSELTEKHDVDDAVFLVDSGPWLKVSLNRYGLRFRHETHGNRNAVERLFQEVKRRTYQFEIASETLDRIPPKPGSRATRTYGINETKHGPLTVPKDSVSVPNEGSEAGPKASGVV